MQNQHFAFGAVLRISFIIFFKDSTHAIFFWGGGGYCFHKFFKFYIIGLVFEKTGSSSFKATHRPVKSNW
jgi:hypothetical protein